MPDIEDCDREQDAVLWEASGFGQYGRPTVKEPVELLAYRGEGVRWVEDRSQTTDAFGNAVTVDATVVVGRDIPVGSNLYLGTLEDYLVLGTSGDREALVEVVSFTRTPDLKSRSFRRECKVRYFREAVADAQND